MNNLTREPTKLVSDIRNSLRGIAWNLVLFLFAGAWITGTAYTLYSLFTNFGEMTLFGLVSSLTVLAVLGLIAAVGAVTSVIGVYDNTKFFVSGT